jgi:hypothetical protein
MVGKKPIFIVAILARSRGSGHRGVSQWADCPSITVKCGELCFSVQCFSRGIEINDSEKEELKVDLRC